MTKEGRLLSWGTYVKEKMPKTLEEYRKLDEQNLERIRNWQEKLPIIKSPRDDPKQRVTDMADLMVYTSDLVSLKHPMLEHETNCVEQTVGALVEKSTNSPLLAETVSGAFQTFRLAIISLTAKTVRPDVINPNPKTKGDYKIEINRLAAKLPECFRPPHPLEFDLLVDAAAAKTENHEHKRALARITTAREALTCVYSEDWPLLQGLIKRGEELVIKTQEADGSLHMDLVTKIDSKKGTLEAEVLGKRPIKEVEKGMRLRKLPLIQIPPLGIAPPDQEEIKIRTILYGLAWNPNMK